jgi:hypothetical protein
MGADNEQIGGSSGQSYAGLGTKPSWRHWKRALKRSVARLSRRLGKRLGADAPRRSTRGYTE